MPTYEFSGLYVAGQGREASGPSAVLVASRGVLQKHEGPSTIEGN